MNIILSIAKTTIGEAVRRRILLVILLVGILFLVIAPSLNMLTPRQTVVVLKSLTLGVIQITSAVIALVLTVYMLPNEVERRTIYTILSKPVQRWQFIVGKYLGAIGALGLMIGMMTFTLLFVYSVMQAKDKPTAYILAFLAVLIALVALMNRLKETTGGQVVIGLLSVGLVGLLYMIGLQTHQLDAFSEFTRTCGMFYVQMSLLAAVGVFFSTFATPVVNFFLSGGVYLIGSMFNTIFEAVAKSPDMPTPVVWVVRALQTLIPNFQNYSVQNSVVNQGQVIQGEAAHFVNLAAYGLLYISCLLIAGILVFDRKEV